MCLLAENHSVANTNIFFKVQVNKNFLLSLNRGSLESL